MKEETEILPEKLQENWQAASGALSNSHSPELGSCEDVCGQKGRERKGGDPAPRALGSRAEGVIGSRRRNQSSENERKG